MIEYLSTLVTAISQFLNVLIFLGDPDETISGRSFRQGVLESHKGWQFMERVVNTLFFFEKNHCEMAYYRDVENARLIVERDNHYR